MSPLAATHPELVARCHRAADAVRWAVTPDVLAEALDVSVCRHFRAGPPDDVELGRYLESLHLGNLALACACSNGHEGAWAHVMATYRPELHRAANAMDPSGAAREVADGLYGELFGLRERDGRRQSLFRYFHGRSTLGTWLRAVLAQRVVDKHRAGRRTDRMPEDESGEVTLPAPPPRAEPAEPAFLASTQRALKAAISRLAPRDRLRLGLYHGQGLTLAEIGRAVSEHEATVSRHLTRVRRQVREDVEAELQRLGFDARAQDEGFRSLTANAGPLDLADLLGASAATRKIEPPDRSTK